MNYITNIARVALLLVPLFIIAACGGGGSGGGNGGGSVTPTITLKLSTSGTPSANLAGIGITITLADGVTPALNTDGSVANSVVTVSGVAVPGSVLAPVYTPATSTTKGKLRFALATTPAAGFGAGEFAQVKLNIGAGKTPVPGDFSLVDFIPVSISGAPATGLISNLTADIGSTLLSITVTPATPNTAIGATQQFTATGTYNDNSTKNLTASVTWSSSSTSVATVAPGGKATAVTAGSVTITATSGTIVGASTLTVQAVTSTPTLTSITVTPANPGIAVGATQQFTATGTYSDASTKDLTASVAWSSSGTSVATITSGGKATAVAAGSATITAISGNKTGTTTLTVTAATKNVWTNINPHPFSALAIAPTNSQLLYGVASDGVYKSTNGGASWSSSPYWSPYVGFLFLAIDPADSQTVYAGGVTYKTSNGGTNWTLLTNQGGSYITFDPSNPQMIYTNRIKSTDGGASWSQFSTVPLPNLTIDPGNSQVLYYFGSVGEGVYKSTNGGASWSTINNGLPAASQSIFSLVIDPSNSQVLYVGMADNGTGHSVYKTTNGGNSWSAIGSGLPTDQFLYVYSLAIDPKNTQVIYAAVGDWGVYKSTNGGTSWSAINNGPDTSGLVISTFSLTIDPTNTNVIYALSSLKGVYKTTTGGQ